MSKSEDTGKKSKTKTIKKRSIYVYLPSIETVKRWKTLASKEKISISKFVFEHVESSISSSDDVFNRTNLINRMKSVEEENKQLHKENKMLNKAIDNLEGELRAFRSRPFISSKYEIVSKYDKELISILEKRGLLRSDEILDLLGINPTNSQEIKAVIKQLENLEEYGLVKVVPGGWRWVKK